MSPTPFERSTTVLKSLENSVDSLEELKERENMNLDGKRFSNIVEVETDSGNDEYDILDNGSGKKIKKSKKIKTMDIDRSKRSVIKVIGV